MSEFCISLVGEKRVEVCFLVKLDGKMRIIKMNIGIIYFSLLIKWEESINKRYKQINKI